MSTSKSNDSASLTNHSALSRTGRFAACSTREKAIMFLILHDRFICASFVQIGTTCESDKAPASRVTNQAVKP